MGVTWAAVTSGVSYATSLMDRSEVRLPNPRKTKVPVSKGKDVNKDGADSPADILTLAWFHSWDIDDVKTPRPFTQLLLMVSKCAPVRNVFSGGLNRRLS